jgi:hypothetical protein
LLALTFNDGPDAGTWPETARVAASRFRLADLFAERNAAGDAVEDTKQALAKPPAISAPATKAKLDAHHLAQSFVLDTWAF